MNRIDIKQAADFLRERDYFLILMHGSPDGDTLGCGHALCGALQGMGKKARVICPDPIPRKFDYLKNGIILQEFEPQTIVAVDVADSKLLYDLRELCEKADLCIDHHLSNTGYAERLLIEPDFAANAELIYLLLKSMPEVKITKEIAQCLYTGIATDCGCFKYSNTTPQTHIFAAELMSCGIDFEMINYTMFELKTQGRLKLEQLVFSNIRYYGGGRIAAVDVTKALIDSIENIDSEDVGALAAMTRQIEGVDIGICIKEKKPGLYKVSVRTSRAANAAEICRNFGGGGHERAAGCSFETSIADAEEQTVAAAAKALGITL